VSVSTGSSSRGTNPRRTTRSRLSGSSIRLAVSMSLGLTWLSWYSPRLTTCAHGSAAVEILSSVHEVVHDWLEILTVLVSKGSHTELFILQADTLMRSMIFRLSA